MDCPAWTWEGRVDQSNLPHASNFHVALPVRNLGCIFYWNLNHQNTGAEQESIFRSNYRWLGSQFFVQLRRHFHPSNRFQSSSKQFASLRNHLWESDQYFSCRDQLVWLAKPVFPFACRVYLWCVHVGDVHNFDKELCLFTGYEFSGRVCRHKAGKAGILKPELVYTRKYLKILPQSFLLLKRVSCFLLVCKCLKFCGWLGFRVSNNEIGHNCCRSLRVTLLSRT